MTQTLAGMDWSRKFGSKIKIMTATGFDFQPVFNLAKQCVGTIEIKQVMLYLQNHEFGNLPNSYQSG